MHGETKGVSTRQRWGEGMQLPAIEPVHNGEMLVVTQGKKWNFLLWDTRLIGGGNAYAPTDFLTIGNAQFPTPIL